MEKDEYIYIVLVKALTGLGRIARKITRYEYTHIAISLDENLEDFITFSRRKHYSPFDAGFMHEKREYYAFGKNKNVKVKVFKIKISQYNKEKIIEYIDKIEKDKKYIFNFYSMITMPIFHGIRIFKAHTCMSFVGRVIELSECVELKKKYYKYNIKEIDDLLKGYLLSEVNLEKNKEDNKYMKKENIIINLQKFFKLNGQLIYRMLFKRSYENE